MPEICRFYGIVIKMFWDDHEPPHFHVEYGEYQAVISIKTLGLLRGSLPPRVLGMTVEWAAARNSELMELWELARQNKPLHKIEPLG